MRGRLPILIVAGVLGGCTGDAPVDMVGRAAALARTIVEERDHVTVAQLADWLIQDRRDFELVDIREQAEFAAGHIEHARHIPLAALMSDAALAALPSGRKVVIYSNGTAHAAQAAVLLRLVERDAYALLGGFNHWQAYLNDPATAGVAEMDPAQRAQYQAVACFFEGDYVAKAGLALRGSTAHVHPDEQAGVEDPLGLGLGLGLGPEETTDTAPAAQPADPLGLGLDLGLGTEAVRPAAPKPPGSAKRLLIKSQC